MLRVPKLNSIVHKELNRFELKGDQSSLEKSTIVALDLKNTLDLIEKKIDNFKEGLLNTQDRIKVEVEKKALSYVKKNMGMSLRELNPENNKLLFILHENWSLMASMMMGIQKSVLSLANESVTLSTKDFNLQYTFELRPAQVTSRDNELDSYKKSIFFDYAPHVFSEIRKLFGITSKTVAQSEPVPVFARHRERLEQSAQGRAVFVQRAGQQRQVGQLLLLLGERQVHPQDHQQRRVHHPAGNPASLLRAPAQQPEHPHVPVLRPAQDHLQAAEGSGTRE